MVKRLFDVTVAALGLLVTAPLWILVGAGVRLGSRGPILYRGTRVGKYGVEFTIYKFRTMAADSSGSGITARGDVRITRVGSALRRVKLDELPQLVNVLRGDMSLVGPRPEDPRYVALYTPEQRRVLSVRPGLTSPAAIAYRHEETLLASLGERFEDLYVNEILPDKLALDLDYIDNASLGRDLRVLASSVWSLFARTDSSSSTDEPSEGGHSPDRPD